MVWYQYLMCFFGGAFAANFIPHFVLGIAGKPFPSPFSKPPGRGMSPPPVNVLWGSANLLVGYLLLRGAGFSLASDVSLAVAFAGFVVMGLNLSRFFGKGEAG